MRTAIAAQIAPERVQPVSRPVQILRLSGEFKVGQHPANPPDMIGIQQAGVVPLKQPA